MCVIPHSGSLGLGLQRLLCTVQSTGNVDSLVMGLEVFCFVLIHVYIFKTMSCSVVFGNEKHWVDRKITTWSLFSNWILYLCCSDWHFLIWTRFTLNISYLFWLQKKWEKAFIEIQKCLRHCRKSSKIYRGLENMLIVSLASSLFSLLTELHNGLSATELSGTNLPLRVTLPFYFPNHLTYHAVG